MTNPEKKINQEDLQRSSVSGQRSAEGSAVGQEKFLDIIKKAKKDGKLKDYDNIPKEARLKIIKDIYDSRAGKTEEEIEKELREEFDQDAKAEKVLKEMKKTEDSPSLEGLAPDFIKEIIKKVFNDYIGESPEEIKHQIVIKLTRAKLKSKNMSEEIKEEKNFLEFKDFSSKFIKKTVQSVYKDNLEAKEEEIKEKIMQRLEDAKVEAEKVWQKLEKRGELKEFDKISADLIKKIVIKIWSENENLPEREMIPPIKIKLRERNKIEEEFKFYGLETYLQGEISANLSNFVKDKEDLLRIKEELLEKLYDKKSEHNVLREVGKEERSTQLKIALKNLIKDKKAELEVGKKRVK